MNKMLAAPSLHIAQFLASGLASGQDQLKVITFPIRYKCEVSFVFIILTFSRAVLERFMDNCQFVLYNSVDYYIRSFVFCYLFLY